MKAVVYHNYGSPDVLKYQEIEKPTAGDDEVLIKVRAASVNSLDWRLMRGRPHFLRIMTGLRKPKDTRLGVDVAGRVEAVGRNVSRFKPGDEVMGIAEGSFAELAVGTAELVVPKPARLSFEEAAAVPMAAVTALQGLHQHGDISAGQTVLINGASGGVGHFAVQIAKALGAEVTAVCSTSKMDLVYSLGADHVIDYTREDFTRRPERYDLILDVAGGRKWADVRRALEPEGTLVLVGGPRSNPWLGPIGSFLGLRSAAAGDTRKVAVFVTKAKGEDLAVLAAMLEAGTVVPVMDRCFRRSEVTEAFRYLGEGHPTGKVVVTL